MRSSIEVNLAAIANHSNTIHYCRTELILILSQWYYSAPILCFILDLHQIDDLNLYSVIRLAIDFKRLGICRFILTANLAILMSQGSQWGQYLNLLKFNHNSFLRSYACMVCI